MLAGRDRLAFASLPPAGEPSSLREREPHRGGALRSEQPACLLSRSLQRWPPRSKRVVIVDDSLTVRRMVEVSLRRVDFAMFSCEHGLVFVRWLATVACLPDVLLLDVMVPGLDGSALARALKARPASQHLPSIFLSAKDGVLDRLKGWLLGGQASLTKPFRVEALLTVVRETLDASSSMS